MDSFLVFVTVALFALLVISIGVILYLLIRLSRQRPPTDSLATLQQTNQNLKVAEIRATAEKQASQTVTAARRENEQALAEMRLETERTVSQVKLEAEQGLAKAIAEHSLTAQQDAQRQLQVWREQELVLMRQQQLETAQAEAQTQLATWRAEAEVGLRQDAIDRSRAVIAGKVTEHFVPYLPDFPFNPKDARFIGSPIDMVVFDGLDEGNLKRVVFVEVKTGASGMTTRERRIRDAVEGGLIEFVEIRSSLNFKATVAALPNGDVAVLAVDSSPQ